MHRFSQLGKQVSQNPVMQADLPSAPAQPTMDKPISAFQWISLVRATWTWVLRPLWYIGFKWPAQLIFIGMAPRPLSHRDDVRQREADGWRAQRRRDEMLAHTERRSDQ